MKYRLASAVSRLFDPLAVVTVMFGVAVYQRWQAGVVVAAYLAVYLIGVAVPTLIFIWALATGRATDWDLDKRQARIVPFGSEIFFLFVATLVASIWGDKFLAITMIVILLWWLGFFAITLLWKISGHVAMMTLMVGFLLTISGPGWWPIIIGIPLVAWSRIATGHHSLAQTLGGGVYSIIFLLIYLLLTSA